MIYNIINILNISVSEHMISIPIMVLGPFLITEIIFIFLKQYYDAKLFEFCFLEHGAYKACISNLIESNKFYIVARMDSFITLTCYLANVFYRLQRKCISEDLSTTNCLKCRLSHNKYFKSLHLQNVLLLKNISCIFDPQDNSISQTPLWPFNDEQTEVEGNKISFLKISQLVSA